jgi:hypothetical protein
MNFKPIDEMSLRHLFSRAYAQGVLHLSYIGPVLSSSDVIESSPDCMILDMRSHPFKSLRCEFKFIPSGKDDFHHNGKFDIAVIWSLPKGTSKNQLLAELLEQNGCAELVVLEDLKAFRDLPAYTHASPSKLGGCDTVKALAIEREDLPPVFALCIAAKLYPQKFKMDRMVRLLSKRFPSIKKMQPRGRANVVAAFLQTKPALLERMYGQSYCWTGEIDSVVAAAELSELIRKNFSGEPPSIEDLKDVIE